MLLKERRAPFEHPEAGAKAPTKTAAWVLAAACALAAFFVLRSTLGMVEAGIFRAPYLDQWGFLNRMRLWQAGRQGFWTLLWRQHNEHRMLLGFLILAMDQSLVAARGTFAVACAWAFQAAHALLWCALYWRMEKSAAPRVAYAALVLGAFFSAAQFENFIWPFQSNFVAVFLLASAAILCFIRHCRTSGPGALAAALAFATGATFCMANGVLLWPVFLLMAAAESAPPRTGVAVLAWGAAVLAAYLRGYATPAQHANPVFSLLHPELLTGYLGIYFLNVWAGVPYLVTPVRAGLFVEALFTAFFGAYLWRRIRRQALDYSFYAYSSLFLFGTVLLTALGRINFGWAQAQSSRYATPALIFWISLASAACLFMSRRKSAAWKILGVPLIASALFSGMILPKQTSRALTGVNWVRQADISGLSLAVGAFDPTAWNRLYPGPGTILSLLPYLKSRRLSLFSDPDVGKIGRPLFSFLTEAAPGRCAGSFSGFIPVPAVAPGIRTGRVFGRAWLRTARPLQTVFIANKRRRIVGLAYAFRPTERLFPAPDPLRGAWGGYVRLAPKTRRLFAYGVLPRTRAACLVGALSLGPMRRSSAAHTSATAAVAAPGLKSRL